MSTQVISFFTTIVTARLLSPAVFGLVTLVLVVVTASKIFADAGTRAAIVQLEGPIDDVVTTAIVSTSVAGVIGSVIIALASPLLATFYDEPDILWISVALAGTLMLWASSVVPDALLQRHFDLRIRRGIVAPLSIVLYGVTVIVLALFGMEVWSLVIGQWVSVITSTAGSWWLARRYLRRGRVSRKALRRIRRYARPLLLANIVEVVEGQAKPMALGRSVAIADVGLWGAATRLAILPVHGITVMAAEGMFPALSRLQGDMDRFAKRAIEALRLIVVLAVPVCLTLAALGEEMVVILFGERWRGAGTTLQVLALGSLAMCFADGAREAFKASGRSYLVARNASLEAGVFLSYLAVIWITGHISLVNVAAGTVLSGGVAAVNATRGLVVTTKVRARDVMRALRPAAVGGIVQSAALVLLAKVLLDGFEGWHRFLGVGLGPLVPLAMLGLLALFGFIVYALAVEASSRGLMRELLTTIKGIVRPSRAAA